MPKYDEAQRDNESNVFIYTRSILVKGYLYCPIRILIY